MGSDFASLAANVISGLKHPRDASVDVTANDTDTTVLTVSTQESRKFYLEKLIINNADTGTQTLFTLWDGPSASVAKKGQWSVIGGTPTEFDFTKEGLFGGIEFETSVVVKLATGNANSNVQVIGYEL